MTKQPESRLSRDVQKMIKSRGGYCWKVWGNELTPAGTPDICGVYRGQFIAVETKMPGNDLSPIQRYRISRMRLAGALVVAPCYTVEAASELLDAINTEMAYRAPTTPEAAFEWAAAKHHLFQSYGTGADRREG